MSALALFGFFALVLFLLGRFSATYARLENQRLLRPSASYLLLNAFLCFIAALGIAGAQTEFPRTDLMSRSAVRVAGPHRGGDAGQFGPGSLSAAVKGKVERPLYDSRLVGLLGQPEGLITTAAQALDYQFGFKVSETWFYRLLIERALKWLLLAQAGVLVLSSCLVFIEAGEQGLLEHFGKPGQAARPWDRAGT